MIDFSRFNSLVSLTKYFSSEKRCKQAIAESRWAYVDEAVYRWNTRNWTEMKRFENMFKKSIGVVDYKGVKARRMLDEDAA